MWCGRRGLRHCGQGCSCTSPSARCERRRPLRPLESFTFGSPMSVRKFTRKIWPRLRLRDRAGFRKPALSEAQITATFRKAALMGRIGWRSGGYCSRCAGAEEYRDERESSRRRAGVSSTPVLRNHPVQPPSGHPVDQCGPRRGPGRHGLGTRTLHRRRCAARWSAHELCRFAGGPVRVLEPSSGGLYQHHRVENQLLPRRAQWSRRGRQPPTSRWSNNDRSSNRHRRQFGAAGCPGDPDSGGPDAFRGWAGCWVRARGLTAASFCAIGPQSAAAEPTGRHSHPLSGDG